VLVVFIVLAVLIVVAIGLVSVGRATATLAAAPPRSTFDLDDAVEFVADRLPLDVSSVLSYDDVRAVIGWHLDYLEAKGVAVEAERVGYFDAPSPVGLDAPVLAAEDEGVAYVLGQAAAAGVDLDDVAVVEVIDAEAAYLRVIGVIGSPVAPADGEGDGEGDDAAV
jgi:hypothetical protein